MPITTSKLLIVILISCITLGVLSQVLAQPQAISIFITAIQALTLGCSLALLNLLRLNFSKSEKMFWQFCLLAMGSSLLLTFIPTESFSPKNQLLVTDYLYLVFYLFALIAIEINPNLGLVPVSKIAIGLLPRSIFIVVSFSYFIILPANFSQSAYLTYLPSHYFYLLVDCLLLAQLIYSLKYATSQYWRWVYTCLTLAITSLSFSHVLGLYKRLDAAPVEILTWQYLLIVVSLIWILAGCLLSKEHYQKK